MIHYTFHILSGIIINYSTLRIKIESWYKSIETGVIYYLAQSFIGISLGGRVPRVCLNWLGPGLHAIHLARKMVCDGEVERRRMETDVASTKPRPAEPCCVDPPDEVEVVHVLDRTEIRSLREMG